MVHRLNSAGFLFSFFFFQGFGILFPISNFSTPCIISLHSTSTLPWSGERKSFLVGFPFLLHPLFSTHQRSQCAHSEWLSWVCSTFHTSLCPSCLSSLSSWPLGEFLTQSWGLYSAPSHVEGWDVRHLHSTFQGCSDFSCNSGKSLSAMPMAKSMVALFILISSAQLSSSQHLAGSYRFLINILTDFLTWGRLGNGASVRWRTIRRGVLARGRRENYGQDRIWAMKYSSHACKSRVNTASTGIASQPKQLFEMHQPRQAGSCPCWVAPFCWRGFLGKGTEKVKRKKEQTGSLGLYCPLWSLLSHLLFRKRFWWWNTDDPGGSCSSWAGFLSPSQLQKFSWEL